MMNKIELQQHINNISDLTRDIRNETDGKTFEDFRKNEELKETVYSMLQEIGEAAHEIETGFEGDEKLQIPTDTLSNLANARFNQVSEFGHQEVWYIVQNDLPKLQEDLLHAARTIN